MKKTIAVIRGDGIGPEIVNEAIRALDRIATCFGHTFNYIDVWMGGCAIDRFGDSLPDEQLSAAQRSDAVLLGAVGGPKWGHSSDPDQRPETALLSIRKDLGLYANLRPAALRPAGAHPVPRIAAQPPMPRPPRPPAAVWPSWWSPPRCCWRWWP